MASANMTVEEKKAYVEEYERIEGIRVDSNNILGKRTTNKLLFWDKFWEFNRNYKVCQKLNFNS